ncbi:hypothetical protein C8J36_104146 [Rhizobium sp. PP-F2F-G48]|nr:hypothetical protein C8J36_104146 [Rhizobium sp. PP-F2F-G48]
MIMTSTARTVGEDQENGENPREVKAMKAATHRPYCTMWLALHQMFPTFGQR